VDLATDKKFNPLIADFYSNNKPVAFVCHSPGLKKRKS
jgi:putative intracellular protease/amidase